MNAIFKFNMTPVKNLVINGFKYNPLGYDIISLFAYTDLIKTEV